MAYIEVTKTNNGIYKACFYESEIHQDATSKTKKMLVSSDFSVFKSKLRSFDFDGSNIMYSGLDQREKSALEIAIEKCGH